MAEDSTVFVGIDAAKAKHAVAVAEPGRIGEVRYLGRSRPARRRCGS